MAIKIIPSLRKDISTHTVVAKGQAVENIIQTAEKENVDLIAMTSHGRGGLTRVFYGSRQSEPVLSDFHQYHEIEQHPPLWPGSSTTQIVRTQESWVRCDFYRKKSLAVLELKG